MPEIVFQPRYVLPTIRNPDPDWLQELILDPFCPGREFGEAGITFDGSSADLARKLDRVLALPAEERARLGAVARAAVVTRWSWEGIARRLIEDALG